jgi:hypothetical protein
MKRKQLRFIGYFLVIGLIASLTLGMAACGSKTTTATTTTLSSIAVTPASPTSLVVGSTQQFIATGTYSDGSTMDISSQVTWASDTTGTATISSTGLATGVAAGTANITATLDGITNPAVSLAVVAPASTTTTTPTTTSAATLSSIAIAPASPASLAVGSTQAFTASGTYSDGSKADITSKVTWASDTTGTATIDSTGLATGVATGTANLTAALSGITSPAVALTVVAATSTTTSP